MLKVTHSPIVAAIWLFEKAHEKVNGGASGFSSIGPGLARLTSESSSSKKQRPFLASRSGKTDSQHFPETPAEDGTHSPPHESAPKGKKEGQPAIVVSNTMLEEQVQDLSLKIAELTALIMASQGTPQEEF